MKKKSFGGLLFTIDRPKGTVKEWPKPDGSVRRYTYGTDYGYLPRHKGEDGEGLERRGCVHERTVGGVRRMTSLYETMQKLAVVDRAGDSVKKKSFGGLLFTIDRPKGYVKTWPQPGGREKTFTYPVDYGYLPRHTGEDGEGLDFFVGDAEDGHLESFQKLRMNDDHKYVLDETKFLVGVTDAERETILKLYGPEVWHRKVYRDMDDLERDLPKFAGKKKGRYKTADLQSTAYYVGALPFGVVNGIRVAIQSPYRSWRRVVPNILRDFGRNIDGVRDAFGSMADAGLLTGIAGTHASAGYGLYRGGKALHDRLAPPAPEEKIAFDLGAIRRRISTLPNAMRDAFMGSKPTMMAPMVRRTAPTLPRPVPGSYRHTPGAVHGGMLEQAAPTMLAPMTRQSAPQAIEQWANYRGSGSMIDSMAQRAGQLGYPEAAKARTLGEFRDAFTRRGYSPQEVFAPTDPAMMGRMNPVKTQWQTTSKVGSILARFGLHEKLADSLADHGRAAVYGFGSGVLNGVERPYRALRYGMPVEMRYLLNRNISPSTRTDAAAALAGSLVVPTALAYGAYRGGKALLNHLRPEAPEEPTTAKQAALARYGLDKIADIDKKITGEVLMANVGRRPLQRST